MAHAPVVDTLHCGTVGPVGPAAADVSTQKLIVVVNCCSERLSRLQAIRASGEQPFELLY